MDPAEQVYASQTWESLLPGAVRKHVWLPWKSVTLTLTLPDQTSTTFQVRRCAVLRMEADSVLLLQQVS